MKNVHVITLYMNKKYLTTFIPDSKNSPKSTFERVFNLSRYIGVCLSSKHLGEGGRRSKGSRLLSALQEGTKLGCVRTCLYENERKNGKRAPKQEGKPKSGSADRFTVKVEGESLSLVTKNKGRPVARAISIHHCLQDDR